MSMKAIPTCVFANTAIVRPVEYPKTVQNTGLMSPITTVAADKPCVVLRRYTRTTWGHTKAAPHAVAMTPETDSRVTWQGYGVRGPRTTWTRRT